MIRTQATTVSCAHQDRQPAHASRPSFSLSRLRCRRGDLSRMNSRKRAPRATCAAPWLQWGYSRYPGQTKKRALPHQENTDLCADSKKLYDRQATGKIVSCRAGRPEAGEELERNKPERASSDLRQRADLDLEAELG